MDAIAKQKRKDQGTQSILTGGLGESELANLFLRWDWLPRPVKDFDQGIDLRVEVADGGRGTGFHFGVQSKASAKRPTGDISVRLKKSSVDYVMAQRDPVFLMHSCRSCDEVHWVDAKAALRRAHPKANGDVLIHIPLRNALTLTRDTHVLERERAAFLDALKVADNSWNIPSLGAIRSAIASKEESLSQLDPRCRVKVTSTSSSEQLEVFLEGEEPLTLQMNLQLNSAVDRQHLQETLATGVMREISVDSLNLSGSPLIEHIMPKGMAGKLQVGGNAIGSMRVRLSGTSPTSGKRHHVDLKGSIVRGRLGSSVRATSDNHPFYVELRFLDGERQVHAQFGVDQAHLCSRDLTTQSELRSAACALRAIAGSGNPELHLSNKHVEAKERLILQSDNIESFQALSSLLMQLDDLREIALTYASNIRVRDFKKCTEWEPLWWHVARRVLDGETVPVPINAVSWTITGFSSTADDDSSYKDGTFFLTQAPLLVDAFGDPLCEIPVDASFDGYDVAIEDVGDSRTFRLTRSSTGICRMRRASSSPFTDADAQSFR